MKTPQKRSNAVSCLIVGTHLFIVMAPIYWAAAQGPGLSWIFCWLWFGVLNQALLNLLHECAHYHTFSKQRGSQILGDWVLGPLMFVSFDRYREIHWNHHLNFGTEKDPKYSYKIDIHGRQFVLFFLKSIFLVEAVRKFFYVQNQGTAKPQSRAWMGRTLLFQSLFFASLVAVAGSLTTAALAYGFIYFYGILSLTIFTANLRAIAEHQPMDDGAEVVGNAALRNVANSPITRLIFGAYGFAEHAAHHVHPSIPYYLLPPLIQEPAVYGYWELLAMAIKPQTRNARLNYGEV